ncbi:conserved protein of unknown function [Methylacidimicrobium sp. AP8]|uniref:DUF488 domain-containing protein n=1 Tax=Methylacidimicrobium sp. AP8 TaxID=2730359 RepID=UPI0018C0BDD2|nr:DUF488 domain-containing protein [Methylacidimicrobium sp. AP8]CAB4244142.1 conserved protein of unknown function [Methylacidimicrobium sp. AP8]
MPARVRIRRVYEALGEPEGYRVLVDRIWPRGLSKDKVPFDRWAKDLAPSPELRKWFSHDPSRWEEFRIRYRRELASREGELQDLLRAAGQRPLTLLYGARDKEHNQAVVLREVLEELAAGSRSFSAAD